MRHQRGQARRSGRQQSKRKAGRRATTTGQEAPPPSSRHGTGIYFPTSLQHTAHFSHACRLSDREARFAAAQPPTYTGRAGPLRRRADRTGPAQTGPRAPPGPRSPDASRLPPGPASPGCRGHSAPSLPTLAPRQTAPAPPLRQPRGKGACGARAPLLLAACPEGGHSGQQADQSEGEAAPPARAQQGRRGRPHPARLTGTPGGRGRKHRHSAGDRPPRPAASTAAASPPSGDT